MYNLQDLIARYSIAREARLQKSKEVDDLQKEESKLKEEIIRTMQGQELKTIGIPSCTVKLQEKIKPTVSNWEILYQHIAMTNEFDLLQRRLTETAVKLRWEDKLEVPGVQKYPIYDLSISK